MAYFCLPSHEALNRVKEMATLSLKNKSLVIIGGTTGLGFSAAKAFVQLGARVVIVGRDAANFEKARNALGKSARGFAADAADSQTAVQAIAMAVEKHDGFHGLYHVAGGSGRKWGDGPLHELTDEAWLRTLNLNLPSVIFSNRAAVRQFLAQGSGGSILNMSSVLGWSPSPKFFSTPTYAAAKAAVIGFTKSIAAYYAAQNIRCNVLAPALVETPMAVRAMQNKAIMKYIKTKQPLDGGRVGAPGDVDAIAAYFMSDASRFVTGQVLAIDGGWTISEGQG